MQGNKFNFRPKARIMELLGEQLIRSHILALFELVKNSYDADATLVEVKLSDIDSPEIGAITIRDNGVGMSYNTLTTTWMEPGNSHKSDRRKELIKLPRSERGRLPIGEKGVGRFAVHRLGKIITLVTRSKGNYEVVVEIDWDTFLKNDYLDDATIQIKERKPEVFKGNKTGTLIKVKQLKHKWTRGEVRKLYRQILGMSNQSITENALSEFVVDFKVEPSKSWLDDLLSVDDIKDHSLFKFDFTLNDDGLKFEYNFTPLPAMISDYKGVIIPREVKNFRSQNEFFILRPPNTDDKWSKRKKRFNRPILEGENSIGIGEIKGTILGFDMDPVIKKRYLKDTGGLSDFLKEQGGIRIYRDGLRVYDYGEPGNDWLGLDHRRIQNPTSKLSNQLVLGEIHLDLSQSDCLHEKTSREGFIENEAYEELKYAVLIALTEFEAERNKDKKRLKAALDIQPNSPNVKFPKKQTTEALLEKLTETVIERNLGSDIVDLVSKVNRSYKDAREVLLSSSGAGLGLVTVFHELERGVRAIHQMILEGGNPQELRKQSSELINMFQGVMYLVNKRTMQKTTASELVNMAISTQKRRFRRHNVEFFNGFENLPELDFEVTVLRRMLVTSLVNMLDNAIYWTDQDQRQSRIWIGPSDSLEGPAIIVADNGPGFDDEPDELVEPFFSRRPEGMGIGLYYTDWVMRTHHGRLAFPNASDVDVPSAMDGAVLALIFSGENKC